MTNVVVLPVRNWLDLDPDQIRKNLAQTFPGIPCWLGEYTGQWWALVGDRLVEAPSPGQLADRIRATIAAARPRFSSFSGSTDAPQSTAAVLESRISAARRDAQRTATTTHSHRAPRGHRFGRLGRMIGRAA